MVQNGCDQVFRMKIRIGFEMIYDFPQPTPLIALVGTHFTRASDILVPDYLTISPSVPITPYRDGFGNWCSRIVAPAGRVRWSRLGCGNTSVRSVAWESSTASSEMRLASLFAEGAARSPISPRVPGCYR